MEDRSGSLESSVNSNSPSSKQAACLTCRRSKTRCLRNTGDSRCRKCFQSNVECIIPQYHVGRQKGVKNKRTGLEKAVHRIEQAIEKSKVHGGQLEDQQAALNLQHLLSNASNFLPASTISHDLAAGSSVQGLSPLLPGQEPASQQDQVTPGSNSTDYSGHQNRDNSFALDDAENPLQLLASASDLPVSPPCLQSAPHSQMSQNIRVSSSLYPGFKRNEDYDQDLQEFFGPSSLQLDVGEDIDPIDMGYVSPNETTALFNFFYQNLSHTRWGLDPLVHTADFVRSRSAFLFTSILAASALFLPSTAALSKRLSVHCRKLAHNVMVKRYRSPEIVLAFMVNVPWMAPGKHVADDETCSYMAMALTVAVDISLDKLIVPSPGSPQREPPNNIAKADCITAKRALSLDGFDNIEHTSSWGQRLLRRRERIWLALFVLDRGVCLARGRRFTVHSTPLIETCDSWHISDMADTWDQSIISSTVMRRDLVTLIRDIKASCDGDNMRAVDGPSVVQSLKDMIENFFDRWFALWAFAVDGSKPHILPPYVEILVSHTRLSTYGSVINHPTAPIEVKRFFHAAGLSSALNVMRAAVQGEGRLKSMPNNTAIMITFAACFALGISTMAAGNTLSLAPSIRILIQETADVLERIGESPSHRNGMSALYGRHLRKVVRKSITITTTSGQDGQENMYGQDEQNANAFSSFEPLLFSAMSDNQITAAIDSAGDELETCLPNFQMEDSQMEWLDFFSLEHNAGF